MVLGRDYQVDIFLMFVTKNIERKSANFRADLCRKQSVCARLEGGRGWCVCVGVWGNEGFRVYEEFVHANPRL